MKKAVIIISSLLFIQITIGQNLKNQNEAFKEFKILYKELIVFKSNTDFIKYGFAIGGPYNSWLKKVQLLKKNPKSKSLISKGFVVEELQTLGLEYVASKGKETDVTIFFNKIFSEVIKE